MKKIICVFLTTFMFFMSSCELSNVSIENKTETEKNDITAETNEITEEILTIEITEDNPEIKIGVFPNIYTLDEIINFFHDSKELFEKIKDIGQAHKFYIDRLVESEESLLTIFFHENGERIHLNKDSEFEPILDILDKYEWIQSISSDYNYVNFNLQSSYFTRIAYCYGIKPEEQTDVEYFNIKLDYTWYFYYSKSVRPPS